MQTEKEKIENSLKQTEDILKRLNISLRQASKLLDVNKNAFYNAKIRPNNPATKEFQEKLDTREEEPSIWIDDYSIFLDEFFDRIKYKIGNPNMTKQWKESKLEMDVKFLKRIFYFDEKGLLELYATRADMEIWNQEIVSLDSYFIENSLEKMQLYTSKMKEGNFTQSEWNEFIIYIETLSENLEKLDEVTKKIAIATIKKSILEEKFFIFILEEILAAKIAPTDIFTEKEIKNVGKELVNFVKNGPSRENTKALQRFLEERKEMLKKKEAYQQEELARNKAS